MIIFSGEIDSIYFLVKSSQAALIIFIILLLIASIFIIASTCKGFLRSQKEPKEVADQMDTIDAGIKVEPSNPGRGDEIKGWPLPGIAPSNKVTDK